VRRERYAVVSCHVERPLDDAVWARFSALQEARPGGFAIAALMRPADPSFGEDESTWLERAREAATRAPLGHHTHWTAPDHARPTSGETGARVLAEGRRLGQLGIAPTLFCGGGWYTDEDVQRVVSEHGLVDCTATTFPLPYGATARVVDGPRPGLIPATHSLGMLVRAFTLPEFVHVYFHDTDLLDRKRAVALEFGLRLLARRRPPSDLDAVSAAFAR
jgi:hypothetical protein